jgi:hypothetical protein
MVAFNLLLLLSQKNTVATHPPPLPRRSQLSCCSPTPDPLSHDSLFSKQKLQWILDPVISRPNLLTSVSPDIRHSSPLCSLASSLCHIPPCLCPAFTRPCMDLTRQCTNSSLLLVASSFHPSTAFLHHCCCLFLVFCCITTFISIFLFYFIFC